MNDNKILTIICHVVYAILGVFQCRLIFNYLQLIFIFFEIYQNHAKIAGVVSVFAVSGEVDARNCCAGYASLRTDRSAGQVQRTRIELG
jgi:hypothetical protein